MTKLSQSQVEDTIRPYIFRNQSALVEALFDTGVMDFEETENVSGREMREKYYIHWVSLDERGYYQADVFAIDENGEIDFDDARWTVSSVEELRDEIDGGFMKHKEDLDGLRETLIQRAMIEPSAVLITSESDVEWDEWDSEVSEWWLVSDDLARHLSERKEMVLKNEYGTWWGRTTTGQAWYLDEVIVDIATVIYNARQGNR